MNGGADWKAHTREYLNDHEGRTSWLYLDIVGLVTVGVGHMVPSADDAIKLDLNRPDGSWASADEIEAAWSLVHSKPHGKQYDAAYFQQFTTLRMPDPAIDELLDETISKFAVNLGKRFPAFDSFGTGPKIGCMAMCYALGPAGLFHGYPNFCAAVDRQDWPGAAAECHLGNVGDAENAALRQLFLG